MLSVFLILHLSDYLGLFNDAATSACGLFHNSTVFPPGVSDDTRDYCICGLFFFMQSKSSPHWRCKQSSLRGRSLLYIMGRTGTVTCIWGCTKCKWCRLVDWDTKSITGVFLTELKRGIGIKYAYKDHWINIYISAVERMKWKRGPVWYLVPIHVFEW